MYFMGVRAKIFWNIKIFLKTFTTLVIWEMKKYWVVNDFVSEIRQLKEHPNIYNIASVTANELKYYKWIAGDRLKLSLPNFIESVRDC